MNHDLGQDSCWSGFDLYKDKACFNLAIIGGLSLHVCGINTIKFQFCKYHLHSMVHQKSFLNVLHLFIYSMSMCACMYTYMCVQTHMYLYMYVHIFMDEFWSQKKASSTQSWSNR